MIRISSPPYPLRRKPFPSSKRQKFLLESNFPQRIYIQLPKVSPKSSPGKASPPSAGQAQKPRQYRPVTSFPRLPISRISYERLHTNGLLPMVPSKVDRACANNQCTMEGTDCWPLVAINHTDPSMSASGGFPPCSNFLR